MGCFYFLQGLSPGLFLKPQDSALSQHDLLQPRASVLQQAQQQVGQALFLFFIKADNTRDCEFQCTHI